VARSRNVRALRRCNLREHFVDDSLETQGALVEIALG
jgi:hypothetical protein